MLTMGVLTVTFQSWAISLKCVFDLEFMAFVSGLLRNQVLNTEIFPLYNITVFASCFFIAIVQFLSLPVLDFNHC